MIARRLLLPTRCGPWTWLLRAALRVMADQTFDGRKLRILTIVDATTRLCPAIDVRATYRGADVVETLERVTAIHGRPKRIRTDQSTEFTSRDMDLWAWKHGVVMDFSRPGKPTDNAFAEASTAASEPSCPAPTGSSAWPTPGPNPRLGGESTTRYDRMAPSAGKPRWSKRRRSSGYPRRRAKEPARFS